VGATAQQQPLQVVAPPATHDNQVYFFDIGNLAYGLGRRTFQDSIDKRYAGILYYLYCD